LRLESEQQRAFDTSRRDEDGQPLPVLLTIENAPSHAAVRAIEACPKANTIVLTFRRT
jgi:hypothetical protein